MTLPNLSDKQTDVLRLLGQGLKIRQVGERLNIEPNTVRGHLGRIRTKYTENGRPAPTLPELRQRALEDGLIDHLPTHQPLD